MVPTENEIMAAKAELTALSAALNQVLFGQNLLHDGPGRLEVGMTVEVLE